MSENGKPRCLVPGCTKKSRLARGLCMNHYNPANALVASGETTWEEMERLGLALPKRKKRGKLSLLLEAARKKLNG